MKFFRQKMDLRDRGKNPTAICMKPAGGKCDLHGLQSGNKAIVKNANGTASAF